MPERLFTTSNDVLIAALAMIAALWGGFVSYFRRIEGGLKHSNLQLVVHIATSGFAGLMAYLLCLHVETPPALTGAICGISGHMGTEAIRILEQRLSKRLK